MKNKDETEIGIIIDDDEKLKLFGELLSNKTSRDLIRLLMNKSNYKMKISDELKVQFSLVEHHLKKLEKLGLVKITNKKLIKNGIFHKNYKINAKGIFVMLNTKEVIEEKGILKKFFKNGVKFALITFVTTLTFMITDLHNFYNPDNASYASTFPVLFIPLVVLLCGLIIERLSIIKKKKN